jgi:hypothetical protein
MMLEQQKDIGEPVTFDVPLDDKAGTASHQADIRNRPAIKDVVTVTLSILAFILSLGTVYFNILRTEENVSVIGSAWPFAKLTNANSLYIQPNEEGELTFINSGNRAVVIRSVVLSYIQPKAATAPGCSTLSGVHFSTDFAPTILRPNDLIVSKVRIARPTRLEKRNTLATRKGDGDFFFPLSSENLSNSEVSIDICLIVDLITPTSTSLGKSVPLHRYYSSLNTPVSYDPKVRAEFFGAPAVLVRKTGTIFSR